MTSSPYGPFSHISFFTGPRSKKEIKQASTRQITNDTWCTWCIVWNIKRHRRGDLLPYFFSCSPAYGSELCFLNDPRWRTIFLPIHHGLVCGPTVHSSSTVHIPCNSTWLSQPSNWPMVCSMRHDHWHDHLFSILYLLHTGEKQFTNWQRAVSRMGFGSHYPDLTLAPLLTY